MPAKKNTTTLKKTPVVKGKSKPKKAKKRHGNKWKFRLIVLIIVCSVFSPLYYGKVLKSAVSTARWFHDLFIFDEYPHYEKFGIKIPRKYYVHGIDVSSYQGKIDWQKVNAMEFNGIKINFAFIKATEGVTLVDPYFQRNWRESKNSGVIRGAYHYFKPLKSGIWQARFFLQTVKVEAGDLPPVIDIEESAGLSANELIPNLQDFLNEVEKRTKVKPIIYTGYQFYKDHLRGNFEGYPLWLAHYYQPKLKLDVKNRWDFWQHADNAHIDGIKGRADMNVFNGEFEDLSALLVQKTKD
ncbi:glycoside hydrolase family 25 protein [Pedobacter sp. SD-b]|uniref:Glycoside hydrolase family 25 protein n=1 Tax=Pedobacter segetis TaxID=2793069 RepID=A0ABS1BI23_9SPHI|nr:glycoside hydrolase family 25 protein [Pedobacter segetis]MBK0382416.1 glycoside hydrolase family 25 protein [Pedobacter segetis]